MDETGDTAQPHQAQPSTPDGKHSLARQAAKHALLGAIQRGNLTLSYHPQVTLTPLHEVVGMEAQLNWSHPVIHHIPSSQIISLSETNGLSATLCHWTLQEACRHIQEWQRQGLTPPCVSINLTRQQFQHPDLIPTLAATLTNHGVDASLIGLELMEDTITDNCPHSRDTMVQLKALGIHLTLDNCIQALDSSPCAVPVDEIKIGRSVISELRRSASPAEIIARISAAARRLGTIVSAEGIESPFQKEVLAGHGCDIGQGSHFSKPLSAPGVAALLAAGAGLPG